MKRLWPARLALSLGSMAALLCTFGCGGGTPMAQKSGTSGLGFVNASNPPTNPWPQSVAVADFNGDGTFTASPVFPLFGQNVNNAVVADFSGFLPGRLNP
jgi:hypothetical protein